MDTLETSKAAESQTLLLLPLEQLEAVICQGAANLCAAERDWLLAVAEFDRRQGWAQWGVVSCAAWLSWQVGLDLRAAREKVRVARSLVDFPLISAAMGEGTLSYSKVRAITRIAEPSTEASLVQMALAGTTNHVERIVSAYRRAEEAELAAEARQHQRRGLSHIIEGDGSVVITIRLPAVEGVAVLSAVEGFLVPAKPDVGGHIEPLAARRADAMVALANAGAAASELEGASSPYLVTVHVDEATLSSHDGAGRCDIIGTGDSVAGPIGIARATARRMLCNADVEVVVEDQQGNPLYVGRRSRYVRGALRRAVQARDGCCQFPGCHQRARVHAHHSVEWSNGGPTDIDHAVLLCPFHHRWVHEGGGSVIPDPAGGFVFRAACGRTLSGSPPVVAGERDSIDAHNRTAADGRCKWLGETLDLDLALTALFSRRREEGSSRGSC